MFASSASSWKSSTALVSFIWSLWGYPKWLVWCQVKRKKMRANALAQT